jgi:hypothetical protein
VTERAGGGFTALISRIWRGATERQASRPASGAIGRLLTDGNILRVLTSVNISVMLTSVHIAIVWAIVNMPVLPAGGAVRSPGQS